VVWHRIFHPWQVIPSKSLQFSSYHLSTISIISTTSQSTSATSQPISTNSQLTCTTSQLYLTILDVRDIGNLLTRANFKLLTIDVEDIIVSYPDVSSLLTDLRASGDSAAHINRPGYFGRDLLLATEAVYRELYGEGEGKGELPATFHVIYCIGWKESVVTPKPIERGSVTRGFGKV